MIKGIKIHKKFNDLKVLNGIDILIKEKEIVSVVGKSGAGKTTLLQILGSLEKPSSGEIYINNQNLSELNEKELAIFRNKNIGFIFQFHQLLPELNNLENIILPAMIGNQSKKTYMDRAYELANLLGINKILYKHPDSISGGERQRVAVARSLINNPKIFHLKKDIFFHN